MNDSTDEAVGAAAKKGDLDLALPQLGNQRAIEGLQRLVRLVSRNPGISEEELREQMETINEERDNNLFSHPLDEWFTFTLPGYAGSVEVIEQREDGIYLTEEGRELVEASPQDVAAFRLLVEKSRDNFVYLWRAIKGLDKRIAERNYDLGTNRGNAINEMMKFDAKGNSNTAGTIGGILNDLGILKKEGRRWKIDPTQYLYFRQNDEEIVLQILEENDRHMPYSDLEHILKMDFDWDSSRIDDVLGELEVGGHISTRRYHGRKIMEVVD